MDPRTFSNISACTGIGGIELGVREVIPLRTILYVEIEASVAGILAQHMENKFLDPAPIWNSISTLQCKPWRGKVDILTAGFPCPPWSVAGLGRGADDERNLWPDISRLIRELRVPIFFGENVYGINRHYYDTIRPELREMGFEVTAGIFSAEEVGASHKRERLFIMAYRDPRRGWDENQEIRTRRKPVIEGSNIVAHSHSDGGGEGYKQGELWPDWSLESSGPSGISESSEDAEVPVGGWTTDGSRFPPFPPLPEEYDKWRSLISTYPILEPTICTDTSMLPEVPKIERDLLRASDGFSASLDISLRATGNAVVPAVAAVAFKTLANNLRRRGAFPNII